ncbi:hypothetical protein GCM10022243_54810 [Saccharothrix violaceirubra]|uniref:Uncharacterized protein n=1 Tax=Saccharothrix violaceirubra TaxID=413306 RepID=A0A7W7WX23_9PSEU|nr:hypothetical protein [Saccharothrix violaceirubra]MBB4966994.1 hypothetical protein [Saccharothrix violaceirubra]
MDRDARGDREVSRSRVVGTTHLLDGLWHRLGHAHVLREGFARVNLPPHWERYVFAASAYLALDHHDDVSLVEWLAYDVDVPGLEPWVRLDGAATALAGAELRAVLARHSLEQVDGTVYIGRVGTGHGTVDLAMTPDGTPIRHDTNLAALYRSRPGRHRVVVVDHAADGQVADLLVAAVGTAERLYGRTPRRMHPCVGFAQLLVHTAETATGTEWPRIATQLDRVHRVEFDDGTTALTALNRRQRELFTLCAVDPP